MNPLDCSYPATLKHWIHWSEWAFHDGMLLWERGLGPRVVFLTTPRGEYNHHTGEGHMTSKCILKGQCTKLKLLYWEWVFSTDYLCTYIHTYTTSYIKPVTHPHTICYPLSSPSIKEEYMSKICRQYIDDILSFTLWLCWGFCHSKRDSLKV